MKFKRLFTSLFSTLLTAVIICGCASTAKVRSSNTTFMRDAIRPMVDSGEYPGAISILYNNGWQEIACIGYADVDKKVPMAMDLMFMQCSQTKGFCGVTIAILVEEGKI